MYKDKIYEKKYKHQWYLDNKQKQMDSRRIRRRKFTQWVNDYKSTLVCTDCGMSFEDHPECCDFHHLEDKVTDIARIKTMNALLKELEKCIPLCANCHRIRECGCSTKVV